MKKLFIAIILLSSPAMACGLPPLPPLGCSGNSAQCICTPDGNCQWIYFCR